MFEVFQDSSDKARLVILALTSIVALSGIAFTHTLTKRRELTNYRREKLEEIAKLISVFEFSTIQYLQNRNEHTDSDINFLEAMHAIYEINTLVRLYFPRVKFEGMTPKGIHDFLVRNKALLNKREESSFDVNGVTFKLSDTVLNIQSKIVKDYRRLCTRLFEEL